MAEFVHNKTQRLTFDPSSPNGILLFREVSKVGLVNAHSPHAPTFHPGASPSPASATMLLMRLHQSLIKIGIGLAQGQQGPR